MLPNERGMLSVIYEIRATLICKLPLLTGGVYFEASARENHEGVHAAFLHLCQEVGLLCYSSFIALLKRERSQDVMCFESTKRPVGTLITG